MSKNNNISEQKKKYDFFIDVCIKGAEQIRNKIKISENSYRKVSGYSHVHTRDYYLYSILDQVERVGMALMRYKELFGYGDEVNKKVEKKQNIEDRINRNALGSCYDEQQLWRRKLYEILIELIMFQNLNIRDFYEHYLCLRDLEHYKKIQNDFFEFYGCRNNNIQFTIDMLHGDIDNIEKKIDISKCWYLEINNKKVKRKFINQKDLYFKAFNIANKEQRLILGLSYVGAITSSSEDIHANLGVVKGGYIKQGDLENMASYLALLSAHILLLSKKIINARFRSGILSQLNRAFINNNYPKELYTNLVSKNIEKGDFVLVNDDLAEVISVNKSKYGYKNFLIEYLLEPPIPEIRQDFFPSKYIKLLFKRKSMNKKIKKILNERNDKNFKVSNKIFREALRYSVVDLWANMGLKEHYFGRTDLALKKIRKK